MTTTCGHSPEHARGLCVKDYNWALTHGTLTEHVRKYVPVATLIDEIEFGTIRKMSDSQRIGMNPLTMTRALYRAKRGDLVLRLKEEA